MTTYPKYIPDLIVAMRDKIEALKVELKRERECVNFYANPDEMDDFHYDADGKCIGYINNDDFDFCKWNEDNGSVHYGKLARETVAMRKVEI